jgi:hypothetical protein
MDRFLCDFDRMIFAVDPGNSRFVASNPRLGRREFPFCAATGIGSQRADLAHPFRGQTTAEWDKSSKFRFRREKTGISWGANDWPKIMDRVYIRPRHT